MFYLRSIVPIKPLWLFIGSELWKRVNWVDWPIEWDEEDHKRSNKEDDKIKADADGGRGQQWSQQEDASDPSQLCQALIIHPFYHMQV